MAGFNATTSVQTVLNFFSGVANEIANLTNPVDVAPQNGFRATSSFPPNRQSPTLTNGSAGYPTNAGAGAQDWQKYGRGADVGWAQTPHQARPQSSGSAASPHVANGTMNGRATAEHPNSRQSGGGRGAYVADKEDLIDQHVAYYLRQKPHLLERARTLVRKRPGVYDLNRREVLVEWQYATEPGGSGFLVVIDGPLRQPFADYLENSEKNAEYETPPGFGNTHSALVSIPKEKRLSFGADQNKVYSTRLEAMKVAKEQALVRERAAELVADGRAVPSDYLDSYKMSIMRLLGREDSAVAASAPKIETTSAAAARSEELHAPKSQADAARSPNGWGSAAPNAGSSPPSRWGPNVGDMLTEYGASPQQAPTLGAQQNYYGYYTMG